MEEKRHFTRIEFDASATLVIGDQQYPIQLQDLSLNGAMISRPEQLILTNDTPVTLLILLCDGETEVIMSGHIAHQEDSRMGIMCDNIDVDSASHLRRIVELNAANNFLLDREFEALIASHRH